MNVARQFIASPRGALPRLRGRTVGTVGRMRTGRSGKGCLMTFDGVIGSRGVRFGLRPIGLASEAALHRGLAIKCQATLVCPYGTGPLTSHLSLASLNFPR